VSIARCYSKIANLNLPNLYEPVAISPKFSASENYRVPGLPYGVSVSKHHWHASEVYNGPKSCQNKTSANRETETRNSQNALYQNTFQSTFWWEFIFVVSCSWPTCLVWHCDAEVSTLPTFSRFDTIPPSRRKAAAPSVNCVHSCNRSLDAIARHYCITNRDDATACHCSSLLFKVHLNTMLDGSNDLSVDL